MKFLIEEESPDAIKITIQEPVITLTWKSMFDFIRLEKDLELVVNIMNEKQAQRIYNLFDEIIMGKEP